MGDRWSEKLSEYLDGELLDPERVALESHLAVCNDCARTLEELRDVVALLEGGLFDLFKNLLAHPFITMLGNRM